MKHSIQFWLSCGIALCTQAAPTPSEAQIVPDATLPVNSNVTRDGNTNIINGGTVAGGNLFHSFEQFSVPTGGAAYFNNALDIQNVISRVTGSSISNIDGLIRANGTANLFLLNPNGIIFGPNARLNIGGSFLGSTASSLNFADGTQFSSTIHSTTPLLTVSVPIGLQFGLTAGGLRVQGPGAARAPNGLLLNREAGLSVQRSETLVLAGSGIALEGGILTTYGGRIELGSVAGPGLVSLTLIDKGWALGYEGVPTFGDIQLSGAAAVDASGAGGGDVQVQGRRVTLQDGSRIEASTLGAEPGGTLTVTTSESVELTGNSANVYSSGLGTLVYPGATGVGGNLNIETGRLILQDGAFAGAYTYAAGDAGDSIVRASESVELMGTLTLPVWAAFALQTDQLPTTIGTLVFPGATGAGGNLSLETGRLIIQDGAQIGTSTFGEGPTGNSVVNAWDSVEVIGRSVDGQLPSGLFTSVERGATGAGGNLTVKTGRLIVRDGAAVSASTYSAGPGGNLNVETRQLIVRDGAQVSAGTIGAGPGGTLAVRASESVELSGTSAYDSHYTSGLFTSAEGTGDGGNLTLETRRLIVRDGAQVFAGTFGMGTAGNLVLRASESVELSGLTADGQSPSGLFTSVELGATGAGGNLTVETGRLIIRDGAAVSAGTVGAGLGGTLEVRASESVELIGISANGQSPSLLTAETRGTGDAGDLMIETGQLTVRDGAEVTVSSRGSGKAGNLQLTTRVLVLDSKGAITATTRTGNGGDMILQAQDLLLLRRNSNISTRAGTEQTSGTGGSITIFTDNLVALENSDIDADAFGGLGGQVRINASGIFGTEGREQQTPLSDITASSNLGPQFSGTVEINTPDVDPSRGLVKLPTELVEASRLIATGCAALGENEFIVTGRGGIPPSPSDTLSSDTVWTDLRPTTKNAEARPSSEEATQPTNPATEQLVEAQGWVINNKSEVVLTAHAPNVTPNIPWITPANCHASETPS